MFNKQLEIIANNGHIISAKKAAEYGISRSVLCEMVEKKYLNRVGIGLYSSNNYIYDELEIFSLKHKDVIFSHNTAAYLHGISNRTPEKIDITTKRSNSLSVYNDKINIYRVNDDRLDIGKIKLKTNTGKEVFTYNLERIFVDLIKNNKSVDLETRNTIIKKIIKTESFDLDLMIEYSSIFKVKEKIETMLEVLI